MNKRLDRWIILGIISAALVAYLPTLMTDISATDNPYFIDVGSNMNALAQWGTLHGSAYPLYSFTGAVFVSIFRLFMTPAAAASLYSTVWAIAALIVLYVFLVEWLNDRGVAIAAVGLLGFGWAYWLFASYAEVYSLSTFVLVLALYFALKADRTREAKYLYGLALCCGLSISHARAIALALPAPLLIALPALWSEFRRRWTFAIKWGGLAVLIGVVPYIYLLIRSLQHATWIWGDPSTPEGFWRLMFGSAYTALITPPKNIEELIRLIRTVGQVWLDQLTWPIALLSLVGFGWLFARRRFRYAFAFIIGSLSLGVFAILEQATFPGEIMDDIPAMLQAALVFGLAAFAFMLSDLRSRSFLAYRFGLTLSAVVCGLIVMQNQPSVRALTSDTTGRQIIQAAQQFVANGNFSSPPAFFSPWSGEFWALSYGRDVTGEIHNFDLLPNRAKPAEAADQYGRIYTFEHTLDNRGLDWWRKRLGTIALSSAGVNTIVIARQPPVSESDLARNLNEPMGDAPIVLRDWSVRALERGQWQITLYWQATAKPDRDYSVTVKATDRAVIDGPDKIVAQDDRSAPVYGWYPTTLWSPGEIVRDDHVIAPSSTDRVAKTVVVGLYLQDDAGKFRNFGQVTIPLNP
jgi:hypothetical protein